MRVPIDPDAHTSSDGTEPFEYLELDTGEVARLVIPVDDAEQEYVHELKAPIVEEGAIVKDRKKRRDGTPYEDYATRFVGRRLCLGAPDYMKEHGGLDPRTCPACAAAADGITELIPELRYALPVIRIATRSKASTDVRVPPSASIYVLRLTRRQYDALVKNLKGIRELYGWPPEQKVRPINADIIIECTDAQWKRYEWRPPMRPAWSKKLNPNASEDLAKLIGQLWGNEANRPTDEQLRIACGRAGDLLYMKQDVEDVVEAWATVRAIERGGRQQPRSQAETAQPGGSLTEELEDLDRILDESAGQPAAAQPPSPEQDLSGLDEFLPEDKAEPGAAAQPAPAEEGLFGDSAPAPAQQDAAPAGDGAESLDDILADL